MKYLGIDYGTKKIGLALSDERGVLARPHSIIANNDSTMQLIAELCEVHNVEVIVVGESTHLDGSLNTVSSKIESFAKKMKQELKLPTHFEKEWMSSIAARSHLYKKGNIANERWSGKENKKRREPIDASAAAVILQRFLDRK